MCAAEKAETACKTQDTPLIVPDYDCAFMERTLMEMLRLYHHPVGVTFLFSDAYPMKENSSVAPTGTEIV